MANLPIEQEANARLIAAAPKMLEALEQLMEFWDEPDSCAVHPGSDAVTDARQAIREAKEGS